MLRVVPDLPTITVTQAQYDRLRAALPGDTGPEKAASYEQAVRQMLRRMVIALEVTAAQTAAQAALAAVDTATVAAANHPDNP
jgi:hypothetical protein